MSVLEPAFLTAVSTVIVAVASLVWAVRRNVKDD